MAETGYSGNPLDCFKRNGDKIFIADNCKNNAVNTLSAILKANTYSSYIFIVGDSVSANEFARILSPVTGEIKILDTFSEIKKCLESIGCGETLTESGLIKKAEEFKKKFPKIIITSKEAGSGEPLLHRVLSKKTSINGIYKSESERAKFCVSDLLAESRYDFVAADDIYGLIPFSHKIAFNDNKELAESLSPVYYDIIDFLGVRYFFDLAHSYGRLKNIISGCKGCVILSDLIFNEDVAGLYAVLSLLFDSLSYYKSRDFVTKIQNTYDTESEALSTDIHFCLDDNSIMSACLRLLKGNPQVTPSSTAAMREYLSVSLNHMTQEEILLKAVHSYAASKQSAGNIDNIIKKLADSTDEMARCFCGMFFNDCLKAEFESGLGASCVSRMKADELKKIMRVFCQYGVYSNYTFEKSAFNVLRFCRDDSGYGDFVRRNLSEENYNALENPFCYSVTNDYGVLHNKCVSLASLLDGRDKNLKIASPVLIITDTAFNEVNKILKSLLPDYTIKNDVNCLIEAAQEKLIIAVSSEDFRRTALNLKVASVAFFDFLTDVSVLRALINKALSYGAKVVLTADYSDASGHLADVWQNNVLSVNLPSVPVGVCEVPVKENSSYRNYGDVVNRLDEVYGLLCGFATGKSNLDVKEMVDKYCIVLNDLSLKTYSAGGETTADFSLINAIGKNYEGIYKNSISIGNGGDKILEDNAPAANSEKQEGVELIFFNTCIRYLRRACNVYANDCADCAEYSDKLIVNKSSQFRKCTDAVFKSAIELYEKAMSAQGNIDIFGGSKNYEKVIKDIKSAREYVKTKLARFNEAETDSRGPFSVPYRVVQGIRDEAYKVYSEALKKYYVNLNDIFEKASDELLESFKKVNEGF